MLYERILYNEMKLSLILNYRSNEHNTQHA